MRTHPSKDYDFSDYDRLSREQKNYFASVENEDKRERLHQMEANNCQPFSERGIRLNSFPAGSEIGRIVQEQGWQHFVRTPRGFDAKLVAEFYACMHPPTFCYRDTVVMRGTTIRISAQDICTYHGLNFKPQLERSVGLSGDAIFRIPYNPVIAASLRRNGFPRWDASHKYCLLKSDLHPDLGVIMLFIKASLKPSSYNTSADQQVAEVLYSLQHNLELDAGQIIWHELLDAGVKLDGKLPFPCMITDFCMRAGFQAFPALPPEDFFKKHLTIQITAAKKLNQRRLNSGEAWEREMAIRELPSSDEEDDEYQPEPGTEAYAQFYNQPQQPPPVQFGEDTPPYVMQLSNQIQGLWTHVDQRFDHLNSRLDWYGVPQREDDRVDEFGNRRRVRGRGQGDGASGSGQGGASSSGQGRSRRRPR